MSKFVRTGTYLGCCSALILPALAVSAADTAAALPEVEVIGTTPLDGLDVPKDQIPSNVQSAGSADLKRERTARLTDVMKDSLASVYINEAQSNPFQPDVSFRGFTASPLLGNPIGISVFVDGVRVNESFGDTVFWDLIPTSAIERVDLIPGAGSVFGLNTLGGALTLSTKSGRTDPGVAVDVSGGSFGRRSGELSAGGTAGAFDAFVSASYYEEDGWRDFSPTRVRQLFGKFGWEGENSRVALSYTRGDNRLIGNGLVPEELLEERRESVYTHPDETEPTLDFVNLVAGHEFGAGWQLTGNVYWRRLEVATFNGDAEYEDGDTPLDITDDEYEAENRRTTTGQTTKGVALQLAWSGTLAGRMHRMALGASYDDGDAEFRQLEQEADFTTDRGTVGDGEFELDTHVDGRNTYEGIYLTDTFEVSDGLHLTLSGRYNHAQVEIEDLSGEEPELNGDHSFSRFNPAAGVTWVIAPAVTAYAGYNEGFRVPTPVELTCADPDDPCSLPVGFVADPPLDPVIAKSWETGLRGVIAGNTRWNASLYRTRLTDDILFTAVGGSQGFFDNVPSTRRQGLEVGMSGSVSSVRWDVDYSYVEATFESSVELFNPVANEADPSQPETILVSAGDRLPGVPSHLLKLGVDWQALPSLSFGAQLLRASSQFMRGDESNEHETLPGYTVVGLRAAYSVTDSLRFYARVDNVFDKEYVTLGAFNRTAFDEENEPLEGVGPGPVQRFVSPGAPRNYWVGFNYAVGGK